MKGHAPISGIYRLGEGTGDEARLEREHRLFARLWQEHALFCIRAGDLDHTDPLDQHVINIANQRYGRRQASGKGDASNV